MSKRKPLPRTMASGDSIIMDELLGEKDAKQLRWQSAETLKRESGKMKFTHYLTPNTSFRFETMHTEIRRITRSKLAKSVLIEAALQLALDDFEKRGENSKIIKLLL